MSSRNASPSGRLIVCAQVTPEAWKNGGGVTRVLLADDSVPWRWRISVADIASDGPFSHYPGVDRWFVVAAGSGAELTIAGTAYRLGCTDGPLGFSGASPAVCRLHNGKVRDLNLMLRGIRGRMIRAVPEVPYVPSLRSCGLFTATPGRCVSNNADVVMPSFSLVWFSTAPRSLCWSVAETKDKQEGGPTEYWLTIDTPAPR